MPAGSDNLGQLVRGLIVADSLILKALNTSALAEGRAIERRLFQALGLSFLRRARRAVEAAVAEARSGPGEIVSTAELKRVLARSQDSFEGWAGEVQPVIETAVEESYRLGKVAIYRKASGKLRGRLAVTSPHLERVQKAPPRRRFVDVRPSFGLVDDQAMAALVGNQTFWIGRHYDTDLSGRIAAISRNILIDSGLDRREASIKLQEAMVAEFGLDPAAPFLRGPGIEIPRGWRGTSIQYFEGLATNAATVGRVHGSMRAMSEIGATKYTIVNPDDERTCERCKFMDGKSFEVRRAQAAIDEETEEGLTPTNIKARHPFSRDVAELRSSSDLLRDGYGYPPFHFRCRCTVDISEDADISWLPGPGQTPEPEPGATAPPTLTEMLESSPATSDVPLGGGINESRVVTLQTPTGPLRGVFKPKSGEAEGVRPGIETGTSYARERMAYRLDQATGLGLVPPTVVREVGGRGIGSFQMFAEDAFKLSAGKHDVLDRTSFEKLRMFDFIVGNSDRHSGNLLLRKIGDRWHPVAIDNGLIAASRPPSRFITAIDPSFHEFGSEALEWLRAVDGPRIARIMAEEGMDRQSITLALRRLERLKKTPSIIDDPAESYRWHAEARDDVSGTDPIRLSDIDREVTHALQQAAATQGQRSS